MIVYRKSDASTLYVGMPIVRQMLRELVIKAFDLESMVIAVQIRYTVLHHTLYISSMA